MIGSMTSQVERQSTKMYALLLAKMAEDREEMERALAERLPQWLATRDAEQMMAMEREIHEKYRAGADAVVAEIMGSIVHDEDFQRQTAKALGEGEQRYKGGDKREVEVTLLGGTKIRVRVPYKRPDISKRPGRKRAVGRRGKGGAGLYPVLAALGIWFGVTPAVASAVCKQVSASESVRAGRRALAERHLDLGHKQTLRLVDKVGQRMLAQRQQWQKQVSEAPPQSGPLVGKRVVVAVDGGRLRERVSSGRGRRRAATGHRRYDTPWREPKLLVIHVVDEQGELDESFRAVHDGTLGDCNALWDMLVAYLQALGAAGAKELIVVGDGACWIWERIGALTERLGLEPQRCREVIDWSHAVSKLHKIADEVKAWSSAQRQEWIKTAKDLLWNGRSDELLAHIDQLAVGRRAKAIRSQRKYFQRNAARMQYKMFDAAGVPTGSGAVESAVRCIINQRLKGCGKFWKEQSAESMLLLRSYLHTERFDDLFAWSLAQATPWWRHDTLYALSPVVPSPPATVASS